MSAAQLPTIPGKVDGIVGMDPCVLQCRACGATATQDVRGAGLFITLSGFHFHVCDGRSGLRMCPSCLAAAKAACGSSRCANA